MNNSRHGRRYVERMESSPTNSLKKGPTPPLSLIIVRNSLEHLHHTILDMAIYWKQCLKIQWNVLGDNMTKFFFSYDKEIAACNRIRSCKVEDGKWIDDQDEFTYYAV